MATATMAMAGFWRMPNNGAQDAVFTTIQPTGQEARATAQHSGNSGAESNVSVCRLNDETANGMAKGMPGLSEVPRGGGRRRKGRRLRSRSWHEKKTDSEFDIVIVPSDGCYMSGSDSDDSDWSVGWFEPHSAEFTSANVNNLNEGEESFGVLVPSYSLPSAPEFSSNSTGQVEERDSNTPAWATLLANLSSHTSPESQKQLDLWLASLTS